MSVHTSTFELSTNGFSDVHNLTSRVRDILRSTRLAAGLITIFVPGSTAGLTTIEFEGGVIEDLKKAIERLAPQGVHYDHDARWGDGNGFAHIRAALLGPSLTVPFSRGTPTWHVAADCSH